MNGPSPDRPGFGIPDAVPGVCDPLEAWLGASCTSSVFRHCESARCGLSRMSSAPGRSRPVEGIVFYE